MLIYKINDDKGATLIELMGTVLVFMIGISALLGVFYASSAMAKRAEHAYTAYNIAKNHIEDLKSFSFSDLTATNEDKSVVDENGVSAVGLSSGLYVRTTTVTPSYNGDASLALVDVQVWYFLTQSDRQIFLAGTTNPTPVEMTTVIFQNG